MEHATTILRTARLTLRRARPEDLAGLHAVLSDPEAMTYWSTTPHVELAQTERWLEAMISAPPEESEDFVMEYEGTVAGKVGFYRLPEIGFILRRDLWGQGLAFEGASAVIEHVFATRDLTELRADADPRNTPSLRLLERLGFVETGRAQDTYCIGGIWSDSVYLTLRRPAPRLGQSDASR